MKMPLLAQLLEKLRRCTSGHALTLVAGGLPALIGGAGFATDLAQWYLWKRELQLPVDQAALAGAWAPTSTSTQRVYADRALLESNANLDVTKAYVSSPSVTLADYARSIATRAPYSLDGGRLNTQIETPESPRVEGATEKTIILTYRVLTIIGIAEVPISYSRPVFLLL
jgi:Flp pilus assembly protein TadG